MNLTSQEKEDLIIAVLKSKEAALAIYNNEENHPVQREKARLEHIRLTRLSAKISRRKKI